MTTVKTGVLDPKYLQVSHYGAFSSRYIHILDPNLFYSLFMLYVVSKVTPDSESRRIPVIQQRWDRCRRDDAWMELPPDKLMI